MKGPLPVDTVQMILWCMKFCYLFSYFPDKTVREETGTRENPADVKSSSPDQTLGGIHGNTICLTSMHSLSTEQGLFQRKPFFLLGKENLF